MENAAYDVLSACVFAQVKDLVFNHQSPALTTFGKHVLLDIIGKACFKQQSPLLVINASNYRVNNMAKKKAKKKAIGKKKKVVAKKKASKKKASKKKASKKAAGGKKPPTKSEILTHIAEETELSKGDVSAVMDSLADLIGKNIGGRGPGVFNMPGLFKVKRITKKATKARKGINPFTGEEMTVSYTHLTLPTKA